MPCLTSAHWGTFEVDADHGAPPVLRPLAADPDPSPIGHGMERAYREGPRVLRPAVRRGWLDHGPGGATARRGIDPFVEVSWDEAEQLVAAELHRVHRSRGPQAVFAGSYGWASAGRFHHAQSQLRRFLNGLGGHVRHLDSYSLGAGRVLMPRILASMDDLMVQHGDWGSLAAHTRLFVSFGGVPLKNSQIGAGGTGVHHVRDGLRRLAAAGCRFVNFSPVRSDFVVDGAEVEWLPVRPGTDTAVMLALAGEILRAGRHDPDFLATHCAGWERWSAHLRGDDDGVPKTAEWAAGIAQVDAARLRALALDMARTVDGRRTLVNVAWGLQRAEHGEMPFWAAVGLAAVIGHIGLPGGGFGAAYGAVNLMGSDAPALPGPALPMGENRVDAFIPCARLADMLLHPGEPFAYNGGTHRYPEVELVYWVGGNPFHHHQDLNRLMRAWQRPSTIVVHEQVWNAHARRADIVLPATTTLEREDIGWTHRDRLVVAMPRVEAPPGEARDDHAIFAALARRLGSADAFTEGLDVSGWLRALWTRWRAQVQPLLGVEVPDFDRFRAEGHWWMPAATARPVTMLADFRADPGRHPLRTPSGRIELHSDTIAGFGLADCPGHPRWLPPTEGLAAPPDGRHPLHLISDQPATRLHSQLDWGPTSLQGKRDGREPVWVHPEDAAARGIADGDAVELSNDRGRCLATAQVTADVRPGVLKLSTGAWWDPADPVDPGAPCRHGNPNVLTRDRGASALSQGCSAQTCSVQLARAQQAPEPRPFEPPRFVPR